MSNAIEFATDSTLEVFPAAQSACAQVRIPGERYGRTVATRNYAEGVWVRWTGTRDAGAPLTAAELAALDAAPRVHICG